MLFSTFVLLAFANYKLTKTTIGDSNIHNIANITKLHQKINFQSSFCHNSHTLSSYSSVFRALNVSIGVNPLLLPGHLLHFNHSLAAVYHNFCHFSITFPRTDAFIHPGRGTHSFNRHPIFLRIFQRFFVYRMRPWILVVSKPYHHSITLHPKIVISLTNFTFSTKFQPVSSKIDICFHISPGLFSLNKWPLLTLTGPPFHCSHRTRLNHSMLLLLIIGGVEVNPGPSSSPNLTIGMLNTRSVVNNAPLLHSLITDNDLSILAITVTWVKSDDPPVIINGPAPPGYCSLHVHQDNPDQNRGGGLAVIHRDTIFNPESIK